MTVTFLGHKLGQNDHKDHRDGVIKYVMTLRPFRIINYVKATTKVTVTVWVKK